MSVSKLDWAPLRRSSPDPDAPSTPPAPLLALLSTISNLGLILALPFVIPYTVIRHLVLGPRAKWMDLRAHLLTNIIRIALIRFSYFLPSRNSKKEWSVPSEFKNGCKLAPGVKASIVCLHPATTPREGFAVCDAVRAVPTPGFMLSPKGIHGSDPASDGEKVILYFVGGAYAFGHPLERPFAWTMASSFGVRVLGVNYRKVLTSADSFPAPLIDALSGWDYLTRDLGFEPKNITFIGESAGAHLSLMLSRYLADIGVEGPGALALSGPWCDLSPHSTKRASMTDNWGTDYIPWLGAKSAKSAGRHYTLAARDGPYFAPVNATKKEWQHLVGNGKKVYVHAGQMELLIDEIRVTVKNMKAAGVDVTIVEEVGGVHVSPTMAAIFPTAHSWEVWEKDVGPLVNRKY